MGDTLKILDLGLSTVEQFEFVIFFICQLLMALLGCCQLLLPHDVVIDELFPGGHRRNINQKLIIKFEFSTNSLELRKLHCFEHRLHIANILEFSRSKDLQLSHMSVSATVLVLNNSDLNQIGLNEVSPLFM